MKPLWVVFGTLCILLFAALGFALSGLYNISARVPHLAPTTLLLETVRNRSIARHSNEIMLPSFDQPEFAQSGAIHFDATCQKCHGAPGQPREEFAQGLYPAPPSLRMAMDGLSREEIFWVISNGLKMTGMPAFGGNHKREDMAGMVAFIEKLPDFDDQDYNRFIEEATAFIGSKDHHGEPSQNMSQQDDDENEHHHH